MISLYSHFGGYGAGFYYDPTYILIIIAAVIALIAQFRVSTTFSKYASVTSRSKMTGAMAAERILHSQGIYDVQIQKVSGKLTDNYNPKTKVLSLSEAVHDFPSVSAVGVAAHECGHAIQHAKEYAPLMFRSTIFPAVNIGSKLSWVFIILGVLLSFNQVLLYIGIFMFSLAVLFQLVTLPVEFNASSRALELLGENGILYEDEISQTKKVLSAAALTYVAAAASAVLQLIRLLLIFGGRSRD